MISRTINYRGVVANSIKRSNPIETYEERKRRKEKTKAKDEAIRMSESSTHERICASPRLLK